MTSASPDPLDALPSSRVSLPPVGSAPPVKVIILANPYSGARKNREHVAELAGALAAEGLQPRPIWQLEELEALSREPGFRREYRCVVAAGGDGTLNRTINYRLGVPLAVLPLGNENLFARQFDFTADPVLLAGKICRGQTRVIDLGRAGQRLFSVVASGGFDGDVAHRLASWRQGELHLRRVGSRSYVLPIAASICRYPFPAIELEADGQRFEGALAMVFNVPRYAIGLRLCPDALPDDGWLDWVVFMRPGRVRLALYAAAVALARHRRLSDVQYGRARQIRLRSAAHVPLELDGEAAEFTPIEISVEPSALTIVTA
jgi:diacylglycerol kinase (ATP)